MKDKLIAGVLISATLLFFFFQVSSQPVRSIQWFAEVTAEESQRIYTDLGGEQGQKPVVVFETDWCSVCKALRATLDEQLIKYVAVNIEKEEKARLHYISLLAGRQGGIPLTLVGTKAVRGYNMAKIEKAYREFESQSIPGAKVITNLGVSE